MRFSVSVPALFRMALLSTGFSMACFDGRGTDPPPTLHIGIEPRRATVSQGDSSEIVAVVSANFKLVNEPQVFVSGAPPGVDVRVSRINQATTLASVGLQV